MIFRIAPVCLLFAVNCAMGQKQGVLPDPVVRGLARDLAEIQQSVEEAKRKQEPALLSYYFNGAGGVASVKVTGPSTPIRAGASDTARAVAIAKQGDEYQVIDKVNEWYAVVLNRPGQPPDGGWVNAANVVPQNVTQSVSGMNPQLSQYQAAAAKSLLQGLIEQASRLRKAYENNQYVTVSGFDVGLPLTLTLSFEFKPPPATK